MADVILLALRGSALVAKQIFSFSLVHFSFFAQITALKNKVPDLQWQFVKARVSEYIEIFCLHSHAA